MPGKHRVRKYTPRHAAARKAPVKATAALVSLAAASAVISPTAGAVDGIDVSSHQNKSGPIQWVQTSVSGQNFTYVKATEGTDYVNPSYISDSNVPKYVGMAVGSYHYAQQGAGSAAEQANFFANTSIVSHFPTLPPVLDLEETGGLSPKQLQDWVREYVTVVKLRTGRDPMIYTSPTFWRTAMEDTKEFSNLPLWLAHYDTNTPDVPGGWGFATIHQYSSEGSVPGINGPVDMNKFNGNELQLASFLR